VEEQIEERRGKDCPLWHSIWEHPGFGFGPTTRNVGLSARHEVGQPFLVVWRYVRLEDFGDQDMPGDSVEGLGDINSSYEGSKGGFAMILAFENGLRERGE
jgi:hypothetical protein